MGLFEGFEDGSKLTDVIMLGSPVVSEDGIYLPTVSKLVLMWAVKITFISETERSCGYLRVTMMTA